MKSKIILVTVGFVPGILLGMLIYHLVFPIHRIVGLTEVKDMTRYATSVDDANAYFNNYYEAEMMAKKMPVKGVNIDMDQYFAMDEIARQASANSVELSGFRVYYGKKSETDPTRLSIVVGVRHDPDIICGTDACDMNLYTTNIVNFDPCPVICDVNSPVTKPRR